MADKTRPNPTGSELEAALREAGIGRATFFKRRKAGASVDAALRPPETAGPGKSTKKPGYEQALQQAIQRGLLDETTAPSLVHFSRNIERGLPPELAILARTRWTPEEIKTLQQHAKTGALTPRRFIALLMSFEFRQYISLLFEHSNCVNADQFYTIVLMLVKMIQKGQTTDGDWRDKSGRKRKQPRY